MKKSELIDLLARCHGALEAVTDRHGCNFKTAVILVDCENALNNINQQKNSMAAILDGLSLVH